MKCKKQGCKKEARRYLYNGELMYSGYCSEEHYEEFLKEYSKGKVWKQFIKQKIYEIGIIPVSIFVLGLIPFWTGDIISNKIFYINWLKWCLWNKLTPESIASCTSTPDGVLIWVIGILFYTLLFAITYMNWHWAKGVIKDKFEKEKSV